MARTKVREGVTLIAENTEVTGDVKFDGQLYVSGRVNGNIVAAEGCEATVVVSEEGVVTGEIRVPNVVINGTVEGDIAASERIELACKARVKGSVYYALVEMQLGAQVDGQLVHEQPQPAACEDAQKAGAKRRGPLGIIKQLPKAGATVS
jgi:cytoskeletal protein CcmA (bactofilin family)